MYVKEIEKNSKILKTVYSWVMPETEQMLAKLAGEETQEYLRNLHQEAWGDGMSSTYHLKLSARWREWSSSIVDLMHGDEYFYVTAGSSEAIRETMAQLASIGNYRPHLGPPTIHVFKGDYEGYKALASPYGIRVVEHDRSYWREELDAFAKVNSTAGHRFYLSNPSSLDGNVWYEYNMFLDFVSQHTDMKVMVDLCYVGCIGTGPEDHSIDAKHEVIDTAFFSLSKAFGIYYHRVGGMFSRTQHPGVWGNRWFKNLTSIHLALMLMEEYRVTELPDKYRELQQMAIDWEEEAMSTHGMFDQYKAGVYNKGRASDVFLLAHQLWPAFHEMPFIRVSGCRWIISRYCLTRVMHGIAVNQGLYERGDK